MIIDINKPRLNRDDYYNENVSRKLRKVADEELLKAINDLLGINYIANKITKIGNLNHVTVKCPVIFVDYTPVFIPIQQKIKANHGINILLIPTL